MRRHVRSNSMYIDSVDFFHSINRKLQLQALRHGNKRIYTSEIDWAKDVMSLVAKSAKSIAIEEKSEILGMSWEKSIKVANMLIIKI